MKIRERWNKDRFLREVVSLLDKDDYTLLSIGEFITKEKEVYM